MLKVDSLSKAFIKKTFLKKEAVKAVNQVSFSAEDGKITGLLGANGAGKSTTLRILSGLLTPDSGSAYIDRIDITKHPLQAKNNIGYLPHNSGIYPRLTARENIVYFAELCGLTKVQAHEKSEELSHKLGMDSFIERRTEGFSQGQKTKVALARALVHNPKNLILDEPTNGLDVMSTRKLRTILYDLKRDGHCILISSHIMQEVSLLCDHAAIIDQGTVVLEGSIDDILAQTGQTDFEEAFVSVIGATEED